MKIRNVVLSAFAATLMAGTALADTAVKIGVLSGSLLSAAAGAAVLLVARSTQQSD